MATIPRLKNKLKNILAHRKGTARAALNKFPHFLALDEELLYKMLRSSFPSDEEYIKVLSLLLEHINYVTNGRTIKSVGSDLYYNGQLLTATDVYTQKAGVVPAVIKRNGKVLGVLDSSFENIRDSIFTNFLNSSKIKKLLLDNKKFDVGHTEVYTEYSASSEGRAAQSVAGYQVNSVIDSLGRSIASNRYSEDKTSTLTEILNQVMNVRDSFEVHAEYGRTLEANFSKDFREGLISINANIVLIQDRDQNRSWSQDEKDFIKEVREILHTLHFSKNALEEIQDQVIKGLSGKKIQSSKSSAVISETIGAISGSIKQDKIKLPVLRTKKGTFTSLTSIKNMINMQLMEQVAKNMGKGNAKSILNFRTGRFAASAHVEQLVRNKDQSITAFYTYLKYPYATFQPGGRQGYPESRDPRLLISKSIRQLAAEQMSERMKTICV